MRALVFWGLLESFRGALSLTRDLGMGGALPQLSAAIRLGATEEEAVFPYALGLLGLETPDA